jgi:hypothetical protein
MWFLVLFLLPSESDGAKRLLLVEDGPMKLTIPKDKRAEFRIRLHPALKNNAKAVKEVVWDYLTEVVNIEEAVQVIKKHKSRVEWRKQYRDEVKAKQFGRIRELLDAKWFEKSRKQYDEWYDRSPEVSVKTMTELPEWVISILRSNGYLKVWDFSPWDAQHKDRSLLWTCKGIDEYWVPKVVEAFAAAKERYRSEKRNQKTSS